MAQKTMDPGLIKTLKQNHGNLAALAVGFARQILHKLEVNPLQQVVLEIEASIGQEVHFYKGDTASKFVHGIPADAAMHFLTGLDACNVPWTHCDKDWVLVHDDYVRAGNTEVRVRKEPEINSTNICIKKRVSKMDLSVGGGFAARLSARTETPYSGTDKLGTRETVRMSLRRRFKKLATKVNSRTWTYEVIQAWIGKTVAEVEQDMLIDKGNGDTRIMVELETEIHINKDERPEPAEILLACMGLVLNLEQAFTLLNRDTHNPMGLITLT